MNEQNAEKGSGASGAEQIDPVRRFEMRVAHVGVNAQNIEEAEDIAWMFEALFGMQSVETSVSVFADSLVEIMKGGGRGERGHIGFYVNDIDAAERYFAGRGLEIDEGSRALNPDGTTKLVYFTQQIAGFAIHLCS